MKICTHFNSTGGFKEGARLLREMEDEGLDLVWVAEVYGYDSPSLMGFIAGQTERVEIGSAIMPLYSRTPALIAMTAAGIDAISGGRFNLGLGASGPQVIEGFHGVPYDNPMGRTREIIDICRQAWKREPLVHDGKNYHLPLPPGQGTGLGKPLKLIVHPERTDIPIWNAALGDKNVQMTAEICDGWMPIYFVPEFAKDVWNAALAAGSAKRNPTLKPLMTSAGGLFAIGEGDDVLAVREQQRATLALYVGGMGARGKNFYNDLACRYGFEKEAKEIQDLYLDGKKKEAEAAVPERFCELTTLVGPKNYVAERIAAFREAGITHLNVRPVPVGDQTAPELIGIAKELSS